MLKVIQKSSFHILLLSCFVLACAKKKEVVAPAEISKKIQELARLGSVTGLQLAYFDEESDYQINTGFAHNSDSTEVADDTQFQAASLSKQATAILTLKLAEEGIIDLNQPIAEIYQSPRLKEDPFYFKLTISQLLTHTSGLPNWSDDLKLHFVPGTKWQYSGEGYQLIAKILEKQTQKSFEQLCQERIFQPLGMNNTSFDQSTAKNFVTGHSESEVPVVRPNLKINAAASMITTASDYSKLMQAALLGDFLNPESQALLTEQAIDILNWEDQPTGCGWTHGMGIEATETIKVVWQWGDNNYHRGLTMIDLTNKKGLVYLTNSQNGLSIATEIKGIFFNNDVSFIKWLEYTPYNDSKHQLTIALKKAYYWKRKEEASLTYDKNESEISDDIFNNVVWSFFYTRDLTPAKNFIDKHLESKPSSAAGWARNGEALAFSHEYQAAWQSYQEAMELDPELSKTILPRFPWYRDAMMGIQKNEKPMELKRYAGKYQTVSIDVVKGELRYSDEENKNVPLHPLSQDLFDMTNLETFRIKFQIENDRIVGLEKSYLTGEREVFELGEVTSNSL